MNLQDKAIKIHGKDYVQVKDRIIALAQNAADTPYSIQTEIVNPENSTVWVVKATLTLGDNVYTGHAQEIEGSSNINKTSALENAETSAVGRACAMAGIGVIDSIASVDEINKANNRSDDLDL